MLLISSTITIKFIFIFRSLEKNDYNYITATYYLLAERKLRALDPKQTPKSTT